jgi:hypothetical protein
MTGIGQERGQEALPDDLTTQELHKGRCGSNDDGIQKPRIGRCIRELSGAQGRNRTTDTAIFSRMLYQLSYLGNRLTTLSPPSARKWQPIQYAIRPIKQGGWRCRAVAFDRGSTGWISYDLVQRAVSVVRAVGDVGCGYAAMSFSFAKGSASIRVDQRHQELTALEGFSVRLVRPFLCPGLVLLRCRAQRRSSMAAGHRHSRCAACSTAASTAPGPERGLR